MKTSLLRRLCHRLERQKRVNNSKADADDATLIEQVELKAA